MKRIGGALGAFRRDRWIWLGIYVVLALAGRYMAGAHMGGYGSYEDEPAHMVTASMMRSYVTGPEPWHPLQYVRDYYLHFPKVGVGQWPPVLHLFFGALMVPFGVSRFTMLLGSCLIAGLAALGTRTLAKGCLPKPLPSLLGLVFLALPLVQNLSAAAMTELLLAAEGSFAVYCYSKYLGDGKMRNALLYGFWTTLAVLTKGSGVSLVLVPILAPLFAGKLRLMFSKGTVISGVVVGILGLTWYSLTLQYSQATWSGSGRSASEYSLAAGIYYSRELFIILGSIVSVLAVIGAIASYLDRETRDQNAACMAWLVGLIGCYLFIRTGIEMRHLAVVLPIGVVLAGKGAVAVWQMLGWAPGRRALPASALILTAFLLQAFSPVAPSHRGFREAVDWAMQDDELAQVPWLVCSDASGEGLIVSEAVHWDPRHRRLQILRSSKILGRDDWLGNSYKERFPTQEELGAFLREVPVGLVFLDRSLWRRHYFPHHESLRLYLESHPSEFVEVQRFDMLRNGVCYPNALVLYRQVGFEGLERHPVTIDDVLRTGPIDKP